MAENEITRCSDAKPKNHPIETNASKKKNEAKADYFSATAREQENKPPTQTLENKFKGNDKA